VKAASLDTGNTTRDSVLRLDDFFDVARYPTLHFVSESCATVRKNEIELTGLLTIHGVTKRVTLPALINGTSTVANLGTLAAFEATFTMDRTDYGVNGFRWSAGSLVIDKEVNVHVALGCVRECLRSILS
jgi:polyisoprenoid-binding protein YceI